VIDSAANYRFQRSERSIGEALKKLRDEGFAREELLICTKGGYLPFDGAPPRNVREYVNETFVKPGIASFEDFVGGGHCMTPAYLQSQLDQSLRNMGLEYVDVYYIHNPESQLGHVSEPEFYSRLKLAFERLEQNRAEGKLVFYGVATWNGFRAAAGSGHHHSLVRMIELAREIAGEEHGFRFIQLPFNLAMPEASTVANETIDGEQMTVLEAAKRLGVTVIASASLLQGRIDPQAAIEFVRSNPGITTALIGMSRVEHVEENLGQDFRI
jgi:aryl-alcohol dehydrogenase-like predicted oxidoreductase